MALFSDFVTTSKWRNTYFELDHLSETSPVCFLDVGLPVYWRISFDGQYFKSIFSIENWNLHNGKWLYLRKTKLDMVLTLAFIGLYFLFFVMYYATLLCFCNFFQCRSVQILTSVTFVDRAPYEPDSFTANCFWRQRQWAVKLSSHKMPLQWIETTSKWFNK